jgi:tRNA G10  N-methylase Trm11
MDGEAGGDERRQSDLRDMAHEPHRQTFCGSTSMRPRISMCMAWQNQVQKYQ